jgi:hypothetical protein
VGTSSGRLKPPHALILPPTGATPHPHFKNPFIEFSEVAFLIATIYIVHFFFRFVSKILKKIFFSIFGAKRAWGAMPPFFTLSFKDFTSTFASY